jgi:hypothetical protein
LLNCMPAAVSGRYVAPMALRINGRGTKQIIK